MTTSAKSGIFVTIHGFSDAWFGDGTAVPSVPIRSSRSLKRFIIFITTRAAILGI